MGRVANEAPPTISARIRCTLSALMARRVGSGETEAGLAATPRRLIGRAPGHENSPPPRRPIRSICGRCAGCANGGQAADRHHLLEATAARQGFPRRTTASPHNCTDQERARTSRFPVEVCERMKTNGGPVFRGPAHPGDANGLFRGLSGNEKAGALISMMAWSSDMLRVEAGYIDASPQSRRIDENLLQPAAGPYKCAIRLVSLRPRYVRLSSETHRESRRGHTTCRAILRCRLNPGSHCFAIAHFDSFSRRGPLPIRPIRCKLPQSDGWSTI